MDSILQHPTITHLPVEELGHTLREFLEPVTDHLPDKRLRLVGQLAVQGILGGQSPMVTQMARGVIHQQETVRPVAKRLYRFIWNQRFSHRHLLKGLYGIAQRTVARHGPSHLVIALDPVNFEKPYTEGLEGVSTVLKSTPPGPHGQRRLTSGYPAMTATVVNLPVPVITYANWFSYVTADFVSENREIYRAIRISRALFPQASIRFVGDAGLDDQKIFHQVARVQGQFIFLEDLTATVPLPVTLRAAFTHARQVHVVDIQLGWLKIQLPDTGQALWALVAHDSDLDRDVVLLTNMSIRSAHDAQTVYTEWRYRPRVEHTIRSAHDAQTVYTEWRYRPRVEHTYRFDQEDGLDIEDIRVQTLERMRRIFVLVLLAALFVYHIADAWPERMVLWLRLLGGKLGLWLRLLGGKLGLASDRDGVYVLLAGIRAVFVTAATLTFATHHAFPRMRDTYG